MEDDDALPEWFRRSVINSLGEDEGRRTLDFMQRTRRRQKVMQEVANDSDRSVGIAAPAFVEQELALCLKRHLVPGTKRLQDHLFKPSQALGSFGVKIDMGFIMGIYSKRAHADLVAIKEIRNTFAHEPDATSFDFPKIAARCEKLRFVEDFISHDADGNIDVRVPTSSGAVTHAIYGPEKDLKDLLGTLRQRFLFTCEHFIELFSNTYPEGRVHRPHF